MASSKKTAVNTPTPKREFTQSIYVGPAIKGVISANTIYKDGTPADAIANIAKATSVPETMVEPLFVNIEDLADAREKLAAKQSKIKLCYLEVAKARK